MKLLRLLSPLLALGLGVLVAWLAWQWWSGGQPAVFEHAKYDATDTLPEGGAFILSSVNGELKSQDYQGKVLAIYFGYTACPDICPTSMGTMKEAFSLLNADEQVQVEGLLISLDPERDSVEQVERYAQYFHPAIHGATAELPVLSDLAKRYNVVFRKVEMPDSAMGYSLDHSSAIYVLDQQGKLREVLAHALAPVELAQKIRHLLRQGG